MYKYVSASNSFQYNISSLFLWNFFVFSKKNELHSVIQYKLVLVDLVESSVFFLAGTLYQYH